MLQIDPGVYLLWAALLLVLPLDWLMAAAMAALAHEISHILWIWLLGGTVYSIRAGVGGAVIHGELNSRGKEVLCIAAGPAGSLLLAAGYHIFPKLALCAAVQGLFNLLPIYPLDGGRLLRILLCSVFRGSKIENYMEAGLLLCLLILSMGLLFLDGAPVFPVLILQLLILKALLGKKPCKRPKNKVQ